LTPLPLFSLLKKSGKTKIAKISQNKVNIVRGAMARLRSEVFFAIAKSKIYTRCSNFAEVSATKNSQKDGPYQLLRFHFQREHKRRSAAFASA